MTPFTTAIAASIAFGLTTALALLPFAKHLAARLEAQWARDVREHAQLAAELPSDPAKYAYTVAQAGAMVLAATMLGYIVVTVHGATAEGAAYTIYFLSLVLLVAINVKHALLPDVVVLATLWVGLLFHASTGNCVEYVYGAVVGYLVPYLAGLAFRVLTGKEVIGHGDFKAASMAGAWFGLSALPLLFGALVAGVVVSAVAISVTRPKQACFIPTGPAHLVASLVVTLGAQVS